MLDRLVQTHLANPNAMPRETVIEQLAVIFAASHETVAKGVIWTLFLLSQHPAIMAKLHDELQGAVRAAQEAKSAAETALAELHAELASREAELVACDLRLHEKTREVDRRRSWR